MTIFRAFACPKKFPLDGIGQHRTTTAFGFVHALLAYFPP